MRFGIVIFVMEDGPPLAVKMKICDVRTRKVIMSLWDVPNIRQNDRPLGKEVSCIDIIFDEFMRKC